MPINQTKIEDAVLASLWFNRESTGVGWKGFDRDATDCLHQRDLISDPARKTKSVTLAQEGVAERQRLFQALFGDEG